MPDYEEARSAIHNALYGASNAAVAAAQLQGEVAANLNLHADFIALPADNGGLNARLELLEADFVGINTVMGHKNTATESSLNQAQEALSGVMSSVTGSAIEAELQECLAGLRANAAKLAELQDLQAIRIGMTALKIALKVKQAKAQTAATRASVVREGLLDTSVVAKQAADTL